MIVNQDYLLHFQPLSPMLTSKKRYMGYSYGLSEAGYDVRIAQGVVLHPLRRFKLASTVEKFHMPSCLVAVVHDKSTWARQGLSVFNTVIEPGWEGYLTLELVYHGSKPLVIPKGVGIAQILFHQITEPSRYEGKYQNQKEGPVGAILSNV